METIIRYKVVNTSLNDNTEIFYSMEDVIEYLEDRLEAFDYEKKDFKIYREVTILEPIDIETLNLKMEKNTD